MVQKTRVQLKRINCSDGKPVSVNLVVHRGDSMLWHHLRAVPVSEYLALVSGKNNQLKDRSEIGVSSSLMKKIEDKYGYESRGYHTCPGTTPLAKIIHVPPASARTYDISGRL